jgi:hypothetical protein
MRNGSKLPHSLTFVLEKGKVVTFTLQLLCLCRRRYLFPADRGWAGSDGENMPLSYIELNPSHPAHGQPITKQFHVSTLIVILTSLLKHPFPLQKYSSNCPETWDKIQLLYHQQTLAGHTSSVPMMSTMFNLILGHCYRHEYTRLYRDNHVSL